LLFNRAALMNRRARQPRFKATEVVAALALREGAVVADIGAGGGYFSMLLARAVGPTGRVYAVDTNPKVLAYVDEQAEDHQLRNVETVLVTSEGVNLPAAGCDLIFARNVFHHLNEPVAYFRDLRAYLKPEGEVAVIDYKKRSLFSFVTLMGHYVEEELIRSTLADAGYVLARRFDFLPDQSFHVFGQSM